MLLRYCSIYIAIIILRHILFLAYLYPYLELVLHMSYLCDLFFIFSLIFVTINHKISFALTYLFFINFFQNILFYFWVITLIKKVNNFLKKQKFSLRALFSFCFIFCQLQPGVAYKSVAYKKRMQLRGRSRATATSNIECFVTIVNDFQPLTIVTKGSILNDAAALDPSLQLVEL